MAITHFAADEAADEAHLSVGQLRPTAHTGYWKFETSKYRGFRKTGTYRMFLSKKEKGTVELSFADP